METSSQNVEIKAKVKNIEEVFQKAKELSGNEAVSLIQKDIFFTCPDPSMRLKLRYENGTGTLISYNRPNTEGPKVSTFQKCVVSDWPALTSVLTHALGVRGVVQKQRSLFMVGQTRVHIDRVTGLGDFMELEVMLKKDQSAVEGQQIAQQLMSQLGVSTSDLLAGAYMDMIPPPFSLLNDLQRDLLYNALQQDEIIEDAEEDLDLESVTVTECELEVGIRKDQEAKVSQQ